MTLPFTFNNYLGLRRYVPKALLSMNILLLIITSSCASLMGMQMEDKPPQDIEIASKSPAIPLQEKEPEQETEDRCKKLLTLCSLKTCLSSKPSCSVNGALKNGDDCCNVLNKYLIKGCEASVVCPWFLNKCTEPCFELSVCVCNPIASKGPEYLKQASLGALLSIWRVAACGIDLACLPLACLGRPCQSTYRDDSKRFLNENRNDAFCYCTRTILTKDAHDKMGHYSNREPHKDVFSYCTSPFLSGERGNATCCDIPIEPGSYTRMHTECCEAERCCGYPSLCY